MREQEQWESKEKLHSDMELLNSAVTNKRNRQIEEKDKIMSNFKVLDTHPAESSKESLR